MGNRTSTYRCLFLGLLLSSLLLTGCISNDKAWHRSTNFLPTTVELHASGSNAVVWRYEIPVGYQLMMDLNRKGTDESGLTFIDPTLPADEVVWKLTLIDKRGKVVDKGSMPLTLPVYKKIVLREAPEFPGDVVVPEAVDATPDRFRGSALPNGDAGRDVPRLDKLPPITEEAVTPEPVEEPEPKAEPQPKPESKPQPKPEPEMKPQPQPEPEDVKPAEPEEEEPAEAVEPPMDIEGALE